MKMINSSDFWVEEKDALLLARNDNFVCEENAAEVIARARLIFDVLESKGFVSCVRKDDVNQECVCKEEANEIIECADEAALRIFVLDAARTFSSEKYRSQMVHVLKRVHGDIKDYHQGLGFVVAFFLLFFDKDEVCDIVMALHRSYFPGYFKTAPVAYVRDARVFQKIISLKDPELCKHLEDLSCPEAYASKWFVGLCVHVLTFEALLDFFETLVSKGEEFLFQFALSLCQVCRADLLRERDVSKVLAILRLDKSTYPNTYLVDDENGKIPIFMKIIETAKACDISDIDVEKLRKEVMDEMVSEEEKRKQRELDMGVFSDDEIVFSDEED